MPTKYSIPLKSALFHLKLADSCHLTCLVGTSGQYEPQEKVRKYSSSKEEEIVKVNLLLSTDYPRPATSLCVLVSTQPGLSPVIIIFGRAGSLQVGWTSPMLYTLQIICASASSIDRGRDNALVCVTPPSEPCVRFSRTRLSGRWFYLHED